MKFFAHTADIKVIKELNESKLLDGVVTNSDLMEQSRRASNEVISEICKIVQGPVTVEILALDDIVSMVQEAEQLSSLADNIVVKLPFSLEGLKACSYFAEVGIKTHITLCFSAAQALLAAKSGATYVSSFIGRLDDIYLQGMQLMRDIKTIYANYDFHTQTLVSSIRTIDHLTDAAMAGVDVASIPPELIKSLSADPLKYTGLQAFEENWERAGHTIT